MDDDFLSIRMNKPWDFLSTNLEPLLKVAR